METAKEFLECQLCYRMFYTIVGFNTHIKRKHLQQNNHHQQQPKFENEVDQQHQQKEHRHQQPQIRYHQHQQILLQQQEKHCENQEQPRQQQEQKIKKEFKQQEKQQFQEIERQHQQQQQQQREKQLMAKTRPPKKQSPLSKTKNGKIKHENEALTFSAGTWQVQGALSCQELTFGDAFRWWEHSDLFVQMGEEEAANKIREMLKSSNCEQKPSCFIDNDQESFIQMDTAPSRTGIPERFNQADFEQRVLTSDAENQEPIL